MRLLAVTGEIDRIAGGAECLGKLACKLGIVLDGENAHCSGARAAGAFRTLPLHFEDLRGGRVDIEAQDVALWHHHT